MCCMFSHAAHFTDMHIFPFSDEYFLHPQRYYCILCLLLFVPHVLAAITTFDVFLRGLLYKHVLGGVGAPPGRVWPWRSQLRVNMSVFSLSSSLCGLTRTQTVYSAVTSRHTLFIFVFFSFFLGFPFSFMRTRWQMIFLIARINVSSMRLSSYNSHMGISGLLQL